MKRILSLIALVATGLASQAQDHYYRSFITPPIFSLNVSNAPLSVTNLASLATLGYVGAGTNTWGTSWTNFQGAKVQVTNDVNITNTSLTFESFNAFQDVSLWVEHNVTPIAMLAPSQSSNSFGSILIRLVGTSGANSAVNFVFSALPDGTNEVTTAGDVFTVGVTANTTVPVCIVTNIPAGKFIGSRKIRLRSVTNTDTDATSNVTVTHVGLVGFSP